jgi:hypothetical protein
MRALILVAALLFLRHALPAQDGPSQTGHGKADGKSFSFSVTEQTVRKTPPWRSNAAHPPFPIRRAIAIARQQLDRLVRDPAVWQFEQICLSEFPEGRWVYFVSFHREYPPNVAVFGADYFHIPVLMDGSTVRPKVTYVGTDKYKRLR